MGSNFFLNTITHLFKEQEFLLFNNISEISENEVAEVGVLLQKHYDLEKLNYPYIVPEFELRAAVWAAEFVYKVAQLILYREDAPGSIEVIMPSETLLKTASNFISVDLCFRFLPDMLVQLRLIDAADKLIPLIEQKLAKWHFSAINTDLDISEGVWNDIKVNDCLSQLYINRIVKYKNSKLAQHPEINKIIFGQIGLFENKFWPNFKHIQQHD